MVCLGSKCYVGEGVGQSCKGASKGVQKSRNREILTAKSYADVLRTKASVQAENRGFRMRKGIITTYSQHKKGLSYLYIKRIVDKDGIHTTPLLL